MNAKEFQKTIKFTELERTDDNLRFLLSSWLLCRLRGGKIWRPVKLGAVSQVSAHSAILSPTAVTLERQIRTRALTKLFEQMKEDKFWTEEKLEINEYDQDGFAQEVASNPDFMCSRATLCAETLFETATGVFKSWDTIGI